MTGALKEQIKIMLGLVTPARLTDATLVRLWLTNDLNNAVQVTIVRRQKTQNVQQAN
jgi:hypothetical protein